VSKEVADKFVEALWKLEEDRDVEALVSIHTEDCSVGNVAVSKTFSGHEGLREFWTSYRKTFDEMKSEFHNVFADDSGHAALEWTTEGTEDGDTIILRWREHPGDRRRQGQAFHGLLRLPHPDRTSCGLTWLSADSYVGFCPAVLVTPRGETVTDIRRDRT